MSLDVPAPQFKQWIEQAAELLIAHYEKQSEAPVFAGKSPRQVKALFDEPLPEKPQDIGEVLQTVGHDVLASITNSAGPRYFGYITGGGNQAAVLAEMIKAAVNQNNFKWHSSPASTEVEKLVMRWAAEFIGYPASSAGVLLSGGSVANYHALAVARKIKAPLDIAEEGMYGCPPLTVYVSAEGHSSFDKAADMLGIGKQYLRKIPVDERQQMDLSALERQIEADKKAGCHPICAIAVAGTTNTGAVDDLRGAAALCEKHDLWYHVDAAYGGPAASLPEKESLFAGLERADSVVINPHKWMYVPFEAGGLLVKDPEHLRSTFSTIPDYLKSDRTNEDRTDLMEYNLPLTKEFKALKVWMTIKTYGAARLRDAIRADIRKAQYLCELVNETDNMEVMAQAPLSIVCFRSNPGGMKEEAINALNDSIIEKSEQDGRIFLTGTKIEGKTALRVCFINHRTTREDVQVLMNVAAELAQ